MKHKFQVGDKVKIKKGADLDSILVPEHLCPKSKIYTITKSDDESNGWSHPEIDGKATDTITGGWRIPEIMLEKVRR